MSAREEALALLMKAKAIPLEEQELRAWISINKGTLEGRDAYEVAHMAILCGFESDLVFRMFSSFKDAMAGSELDNRAAMRVINFSGALEDIARMEAERKEAERRRSWEQTMLPLWKELVEIQITGVR